MADKSVLEKYYDEEARKRRAPTSKEMERDAIEPDTTLEGLLIGPGKAAAGAIAKGVSKLANKAEVFMRPKVKNSLYPDRYFGNPDGIRSGQYAVRNVRSPEEIEAIKESGYMLPKKGGKQQKYFTQTDDMPTGNAVGKNSVIRVPIGKVPSDRAVRRRDVEMYNQDSGKFEALKKGGSVKKMASGGKVSSASKRADGIAQRGKTKGRYL
jgi:hypothetical protein